MRTLSRVLSLGAVLIAACAFVAGCGGETEKVGVKGTTAKTSEVKGAPKAQTLCPITGEKIDKKQFVDAQGKRVYFCCGDCPAKFNKDPGKYIAEMEKAGVTLEKAPEPAKPPETPK